MATITRLQCHFWDMPRPDKHENSRRPELTKPDELLVAFDQRLSVQWEFALNGETESYILQNTTFILYIWKWYLRLHIWWYCCIRLTFNLFFFFCLFLTTVKVKVASGHQPFHHHYWNITHKKNFLAITADWSESGCSTSLFHLTPLHPLQPASCKATARRNKKKKNTNNL